LYLCSQDLRTWPSPPNSLARKPLEFLVLNCGPLFAETIADSPRLDDCAGRRILWHEARYLNIDIWRGVPRSRRIT